MDGNDPVQIAVTPDNQHAFVALGAGGVDEFNLNGAAGVPTKGLHRTVLHPGLSLDKSIAVAGGSPYLFVAETGSGIRVFNLAGGSLPEISGSPFAAELSGPSSILASPTGEVLYAAYPAQSMIVAYTVASDGALSQMTSIPFAVSNSPSAISLDATGKYLIAVAAAGTAGPSLFKLNADGTIVSP